MQDIYKRIAVRQYWIPLVTSRSSRRRCWSCLLIYTSWYWASQLYTTEHATEAVTIVKNIQTFNICSMIVVLYCFINLELSLGVTLIDTRNWRQWCNSVRTINETIDPFDVTAGIGSHLVTSFSSQLFTRGAWIS